MFLLICLLGKISREHLYRCALNPADCASKRHTLHITYQQLLKSKLCLFIGLKIILKTNINFPEPSRGQCMLTVGFIIQLALSVFIILYYPIKLVKQLLNYFVTHS